MDIRQYVQFKKITGGRKSDCHFFSGVVFSKNISNKKMASTLMNPKILVLKCAIDYQVEPLERYFITGIGSYRLKLREIRKGANVEPLTKV